MNPDGKIKPVLERLGKYRIVWQDAKDPILDLELADRGNVIFPYIRPTLPASEFRAPSLRIAQVRDRVCIENEHLLVEADRFQGSSVEFREIPVGMAIQTCHIHREGGT
jgi:hypothetical protein